MIFERLRKRDEECDLRRGEIARAFADWTEHDVQALIDEAVEAARRHRGTTRTPRCRRRWWQRRPIFW